MVSLTVPIPGAYSPLPPKVTTFPMEDTAVSPMKEFHGRNILVVGGAGFVGGNLVRRLLALAPSSVHVVDNLLSGERATVPEHPSVRFTEASIADDTTLSRLHDEYDYVFHLSTFHGNQNSIHDPLADHENNQLATLKLLEQVKGFRRLRRLVYSGAGCAVSAKGFDEPEATVEDAPVSLHMDSPYSISKLVGELYAVYYHARHGLPTVRARFQNVYGPGEILGAGRWRGTPATVWRNVVPTFVYKSLRGEPLPLEGGGTATRDFVYVDDIVRGLLRCAAVGGPGEVYNLASGVETSIRDLAAVIDRLTGNRSPPEHLAARSWDRSGRRFGSTVKARREIAFSAEMLLAEGLARTVEWTRSNLDLISGCIAKHHSRLPAPQLSVGSP